MIVLGICSLILLLCIIVFGIIIYHNSKKAKYDKYNEISEYESDIQHCTDYIEDLTSIKLNDFESLLLIHKQAWDNDIRPKALKGSINGKFRIDDISNLTLNDIFFTIKGDPTVKSVKDWMDKDEHVKEIWNQYKNTLLGSIGSYRQELKLELNKLSE